ncbi:MAG TPA: carbohydrate kinase [Candidatus Angelobacter sp.]|jgi:fructokinase
MKIVSVGEVLWDVLPGAEHLGGAPFNFALHAHNLGHEVCFVSVVGSDPYGQRVLQRMNEAGLSTQFIRRVADHSTGTVSVTLHAADGPQYQIHRPAAYDFPALASADLDALLKPAPDWIYFGTLQQMSSPAHELTLRLLDAAPTARIFYDVNLRTNSYTNELVRSLARHAHVLKLNDEELPFIQEIGGFESSSLEQFCRNCAHAFDLEAVCVTCGRAGCALFLHQEFVEAPGFHVEVADTIGAGDAFSAALVHGLSAEWSATQIAEFANRVGALVASRAGGTPKWTVEEAMALHLILG